MLQAKWLCFSVSNPLSFRERFPWRLPAQQRTRRSSATCVFNTPAAAWILTFSTKTRFRNFGHGLQRPRKEMTFMRRTRCAFPQRRLMAFHQAEWCCLKRCRPKAFRSSQTTVSSKHSLVVTVPVESRKGRELAENNLAALTFWWGPSNRSVRIEGRVSRVSEAESTEYFKSRPRDSQLSAIASKQSSVIASREVCEAVVLVPDHLLRFWKLRSSG